MQLIVDTRQQQGHHNCKHYQLQTLGYEFIHEKLDFGDYMKPTGRVSVDTKANIAEVYGNLTKGHVAFRNECIRAYENHAVLVVLVINRYGIRDLSGLARWREPQWCQRRRIYAKAPISGKQLARQMQTMSEKYGVLWGFCSLNQAGERIHNALTHEDELLEAQAKVKCLDIPQELVAQAMKKSNVKLKN